MDVIQIMGRTLRGKHPLITCHAFLSAEQHRDQHGCDGIYESRASCGLVTVSLAFATSKSIAS